MTEDRDPTLRLEAWSGPWDSDDPDANFKADVALYAQVDPLVTIRGLAEAINVPAGAIVRYVLAKWASGGSGGLLELGPTMTRRLWAPIAEAEAVASDPARLAAYDQLRQMIQWLMLPLDQEAGYDAALTQAPADRQAAQDRANP